MNKLILTAFIPLTLTGCVESLSTPVVADYNGASVKIQEPGLSATTPPSDGAVAEANRICATNGKSAEYASGMMATDYRVNYLFLCV